MTPDNVIPISIGRPRDGRRVLKFEHRPTQLILRIGAVNSGDSSRPAKGDLPMPIRYVAGADNKIRTMDETLPGEDALSFASLEELEEIAVDWPHSRLVEIWNRLPGTRAVARFENRRIAVERIWRHLTAAEAQQDSKATRPKQSGRRETKAQRVIRMLKRPQGASLKALMKATGWQAHTVRGFLSRKVAKESGLALDSHRRNDERFYRVLP